MLEKALLFRDHLQLGNPLQDGRLVVGRDGVGAVVHVAHGLGENGRPDRPDAPHRVLVQQGVAPDGHFDFGPLNQVHRRVQLLELFQPA
jgi:hypothetical protein